MRVDDNRIRKEKVADSKIYGYVWTGPKAPYFENRAQSEHYFGFFFLAVFGLLFIFLAENC